MAFDLADYQTKLNEWQKKNFGVVPPVLLALGLAKEAGKICGAMVDNAQNLTPFESPKDHSDRIQDSLADIITFCLQIYSAYGINSEESLTDIFEYILTLNKNKLISDKYDPDFASNKVDNEEVDTQKHAMKEEVIDNEDGTFDIGPSENSVFDR